MGGFTNHMPRSRRALFQVGGKLHPARSAIAKHSAASPAPLLTMTSNADRITNLAHVSAKQEQEAGRKQMHTHCVRKPPQLLKQK